MQEIYGQRPEYCESTFRVDAVLDYKEGSERRVYIFYGDYYAKLKNDRHGIEEVRR